MPIEIKQDLIEHASCTEDANGITIVRGHLVSGLPVGSGTLLVARVAVDSTDPGKFIRKWGDPHPDDPTICVARIEPKPFAKSKDQAIVLETYRPPDLGNIQSPIVRFTGTTREVTTSFDADGVRIQVVYDPKITNGDFPNKVTPANSRTGRVSAHKAFGVLTVDQIVYNDPSAKMVYLNTINSSNFRGYPKWSWWVRCITIEKQLYRSGWREHWEIELDGDLYTKVAVWRDLNGEIPSNIYGGLPIDKRRDDAFNGVTIVRVNGQKDLNAIGLPTGF